jgi:hypothetical protein
MSRPRKNHGPVPGFSPDPHSCLPSKTVLATQMTGEGARKDLTAILMPDGSISCPGTVTERMRWLMALLGWQQQAVAQ